MVTNTKRVLCRTRATLRSFTTIFYIIISMWTLTHARAHTHTQVRIHVPDQSITYSLTPAHDTPSLCDRVEDGSVSFSFLPKTAIRPGRIGESILCRISCHALLR
eukprot:Rmarinus@m.13783